MKREGILFVISAPSGAGKTSLCKEIIDFFPAMGHSVSYTTRPRRHGERDGVDYHFVSSETFAAMAAQGAFAEWAEVHGNRYGTALATLEAARRGQGVALANSLLLTEDLAAGRLAVPLRGSEPEPGPYDMATGPAGGFPGTAAGGRGSWAPVRHVPYRRSPTTSMPTSPRSRT